MVDVLPIQGGIKLQKIFHLEFYIDFYVFYGMEPIDFKFSISISNSVKILRCNFSDIFLATLPNFTLQLALNNGTKKSFLTNSFLLEPSQVRVRGRATYFSKVGVAHDEKTNVY